MEVRERECTVDWDVSVRSSRKPSGEMVLHDGVSTCIHVPVTRGVWYASVRGRCPDPSSWTRTRSSIPVPSVHVDKGIRFPCSLSLRQTLKKGVWIPLPGRMARGDGSSGVVSWSSKPPIGAPRSEDASQAFPAHICDVCAPLGGAGTKVGRTRSWWTRPGPSQSLSEGREVVQAKYTCRKGKTVVWDQESASRGKHTCKPRSTTCMDWR